jgi:hypothetical protein
MTVDFFFLNGGDIQNDRQRIKRSRIKVHLKLAKKTILKILSEKFKITQLTTN